MFKQNKNKYIKTNNGSEELSDIKIELTEMKRLINLNEQILKEKFYKMMEEMQSIRNDLDIIRLHANLK